MKVNSDLVGKCFKSKSAIFRIHSIHNDQYVINIFYRHLGNIMFDSLQTVDKLPEDMSEIPIQEYEGIFRMYNNIQLALKYGRKPRE